ncbi:hypothetical protein ASPCAL15088 [Aspergillus calidoustus]|uniref:Uncharacterized protein n=1 Tax=Aspergillus calidoustus TaxID=454130 RepID=A0A0U5CKV3_ASPCI|nr:hypothetical protein ASPCAL15088 [Aspergillus calidoustus]
MSDLSSIHEKVFENSDAKRLVMKFDTNRLDPHDYANSAKRILNEVFPDWERDSRILFLAMEVFQRRTFIAIDINHHDYDFKTAHEDEKPLPVYWLRQKKHWTLNRIPKEDTRTCRRLAELHRSHGYNATLPLVEDCTSVIVHDDPR